MNGLQPFIIVIHYVKMKKVNQKELVLVYYTNDIVLSDNDQLV